jgi:hypothetical protein
VIGGWLPTSLEEAQQQLPVLERRAEAVVAAVGRRPLTTADLAAVGHYETVARIFEAVQAGRAAAR